MAGAGGPVLVSWCGSAARPGVAPWGEWERRGGRVLSGLNFREKQKKKKHKKTLDKKTLECYSVDTNHLEVHYER